MTQYNFKNNKNQPFPTLNEIIIGSDLHGPQHATLVSDTPYGCRSAGFKFKSV